MSYDPSDRADPVGPFFHAHNTTAVSNLVANDTIPLESYHGVSNGGSGRLSLAFKAYCVGEVQTDLNSDQDFNFSDISFDPYIGEMSEGLQARNNAISLQCMDDATYAVIPAGTARLYVKDNYTGTPVGNVDSETKESRVMGVYVL